MRGAPTAVRLAAVRALALDLAWLCPLSISDATGVAVAEWHDARICVLVLPRGGRPAAGEHVTAPYGAGYRRNYTAGAASAHPPPHGPELHALFLQFRAARAVRPLDAFASFWVVACDDADDKLRARLRVCNRAAF